METLELLGVALGLATLSGINLYLTVFVTGLAIRFQWIVLDARYESLEILAHPAVLTVAGVLYLVEFAADKVPWIDSAWDSIHTAIRPIGGTLLAIQVLGETDPVYDVIVAMLACGMSLMSHTLKAGTRLLVNGSPEPVSNISLSVVEDVTVLAGLGLLLYNPVIVLVAVILFAAAFLYFAPRFLRGVKVRFWLIWRKLNLPASDKEAVTLPTKIPADCDILFGRINAAGDEVTWTVRCITGKSKGIPSGLTGYLIATKNEARRLYFVSKRRFGKVAEVFDLEGYKVSHESKFLAEHLVLYSSEKKPKYAFVFDRPRHDLVAKLAEDLGVRLSETAAEPAPEEEPMLAG